MDKQTQKQLLKIVKNNYQEIAADFNETRKRHAEPLWSGLVNIAKKIKKNDKILDVGCGNGRLLEIIGKKEIDYLGVDSSQELINIARQRFPRNKFAVGDILDLGQIKDIDFNYVFCVAVFHHLPGRDLRIKALKQLKNKVSPDGRIILTVWNLWPQRKFRKLILKFVLLKLIKKNPRWSRVGKMDWGDIVFAGLNAQAQRYYHAFTKLGLRKIIKKAGLKIEKLYKDKYNYYAILKK